MKRRGWIFVLLLAACAMSGFGRGQTDAVVKEIAIRGLKTVSEDEVRHVLKTQLNKPLDPDILRQDISAIYALGHFSEDVRALREPLDGGIRVVFEVKENPIVSDVSIVGNRKFSRQKIESVIPIQKNRLLETLSVLHTKQAVEKLYADGGYHQTKVDVTTEETEAGKARVVVNIDEGERILIKDVIFRGNKSISGLRLRLILANKGSWLFIRNYFDSLTFRDDIENIAALYRSRGFFDVEVKAGDLHYNEQKGCVSPEILITEGARYRLGEVTPHDFTLFNEEEITTLFEPLRGAYFSSRRFNRALEQLYRMYADEGFILMDVRPDFKKDTQRGIVNVDLRVEENQRVYVGNIKIERFKFVTGTEVGFFDRLYQKLSPPVQDDVIQRELLLKPGAVYRKFQEVRSVERLKNLDIFEDVSVKPEPTEREDVRDVVVTVKPGVTGNIIFDVGYGDVTGPFFAARYVERNLFGEARDFRARMLIGSRVVSFNISYLDRYFKEPDVSLRLSLYREIFSRRGYRENTWGTSAEVGKPLDEYLRVYLRQRLELVSFSNVDKDIKEDLGSYPVVATRLLFVEDHRDDLHWPTKGYRATGGVEVGWADGALFKLTGSYSTYHTLYHELIYALNAEAGLLPLGAENVGMTERLFLGGTDDLRGFQFRGAGPKDEGDHHVAIGGSTKLLVQNELRFPIYDPLKGVVFLDAGVLGRNFGDIGNPRASIGFGFRMRASIFDISLDFAQPLLKYRHDDTQFIHFKLGSTF
jgi:outer membrane protein insertion porin family